MPNTQLMNEAKSRTPFDSAKREELSRLVLNEKEDVNAQGEMGHTALMLAIINKNYEVAHYLIVVLNAKLDSIDNAQLTAQDYFRTNEQEEAALAAKAKGAARVEDSPYDAARKYLFKHFEEEKSNKIEPISNETLFKQFVSYAVTGQIDKAMKLKNLEKYINQHDIAGKTPLMHAIENSQFVFAKWLLAQRDIKSGGDVKDNQGLDTYDYFQKVASSFYSKKLFHSSEVLAFKEVEKVFTLVSDTQLKNTLLIRSNITRESRVIAPSLIVPPATYIANKK